MAVDECRAEEKLIEQMNAALEKLRAGVNTDSQTLAAHLSPQYEMALSAVTTLSEADFEELRSYRAPPPRVLAVVNTLCLMFGRAPGWESAKQLLISQNFYDELVFYDKKVCKIGIYSSCC